MFMSLITLFLTFLDLYLFNTYALCRDITYYPVYIVNIMIVGILYMHAIEMLLEILNGRVFLVCMQCRMYKTFQYLKK